jgi:hypothetical protein
MEDFWNWFVGAVLGRVDGPFSFRFYLQPVMAILLAFRDGRADAKLGRAPYFWTIVTDPEQRAQRTKEGWKSIRRVFWLGVVMDLGYQFLKMPQIRPLGAVIVAVILAIIPYLLIRGPVNRLLTTVYRGRSHG